jgi:hypothetical protein
LRQTLFARIFANFSKAKAMDDVVTESELAKARNDPTFRQQFLGRNLGLLLEALKRTRRAHNQDPQKTRQIKEGADLDVKLADRLQSRQPAPGR